jgi:hypothetical protein
MPPDMMQQQYQAPNSVVQGRSMLIQEQQSYALTSAPPQILGMSHDPPVLRHLPPQIVQTYDQPLYPAGLAALPPTGAELQHQGGPGGGEYVLIPAYPCPSGSLVQCPVAVHPGNPHIGSSEFAPADETQPLYPAGLAALSSTGAELQHQGGPEYDLIPATHVHQAP